MKTRMKRNWSLSLCGTVIAKKAGNEEIAENSAGSAIHDILFDIYRNGKLRKKKWRRRCFRFRSYHGLQ